MPPAASALIPPLLTTPEVVPEPNQNEEVERLMLALSVPDAQMFLIWQDGVSVAEHLRAALPEAKVFEFEGAAVAAAVKARTGFAYFTERLGVFNEKAIVMIVGFFSSVPTEQRAEFDAARNFWRDIRAHLLFVEPVSHEPELKRAFKATFAFIHDEVKLYRAATAATFAPDPAGQAAALHHGEVIEVDDHGVVAWVEISPGERVRTRLPATLLAHLRPRPGLEIEWTPQGEELRAEDFRRREFPAPAPEERAEEERLRRKFYRNLPRRKRHSD